MNEIKEWLGSILHIILIILIVLAAEFYFLQQYTGSASNFLRLFKVLQIVEDRYNGEIDRDKLFEGAMKGLVQAVGDPYTVYLDKKSFKNLSEATHGSFGGVGIVYGKRDNKYVVISALEDGPSAKAGVKAGDVILSVDGQSTSTMDMEEVSQKIRGKIDTEVV